MSTKKKCRRGCNHSDTARNIHKKYRRLFQEWHLTHLHNRPPQVAPPRREEERHCLKPIDLTAMDLCFSSSISPCKCGLSQLILATLINNRIAIDYVVSDCLKTSSRYSQTEELGCSFTQHRLEELRFADGDIAELNVSTMQMFS